MVEKSELVKGVPNYGLYVLGILVIVFLISGSVSVLILSIKNFLANLFSHWYGWVLLLFVFMYLRRRR